MTICMDCGAGTGKPLAKYCDACRWKHRGKPERWPLTAEREAYLRTHYRPEVRRVSARVAAVLGVPKWRVNRWASELGLARKHPDTRDWTPEDVAFLEQHIGARHVNWIAKKLGRSITAVTVKAKRLQIDRRGCRDWWTGRQVADGFGIDSHAVERWISRGWLKADRFGEDRADGRVVAWRVYPQAVRTFIREHPTAFDLAKVDQPWFLDLVFDGRIGEAVPLGATA